MKTTNKLLFTYLLTNYCLFFALGQDIPLQFKHLKVEDGLSQTSVFSVFQDSRGYLWFGTRDGLNKYDTKNFTVYRNDANDSTSIDNNQVYTIYEDEENRLFIGTREGVNEYIYEKNHFKQISYVERGVAESERVTSIVGHKNDLWIAHDFLICIDKNTNQIKHIFDDKNSPLAYNSIKTLYKDDENTLWIGTNIGLYKIIDLEKPEIIKCELTTKYQIHSIAKLNDGNLILGTRQNGLVKYSVGDTSVSFFKNGKGENVLSNFYIRSVYYDETTNLIWAGAFDGLYIYNLTSLNLTHYQHSPDDANTLSNNSIYSIIKDRKGSFWIGTYHGGVNFWDSSNNNFKHYTASSLKNSLSHHAVSALLEDSLGNLWIGTEGGGLNYFDKKKQRFIHYKRNKLDAKSLSSNTIKSMLIDSNGDFWIGTYLGGLNKFSSKEGKFVNRNNSDDPIFNHATNVYSIIEDKKGQIWMGSLDKGLFSVENSKITNWSEKFPAINSVRDVLEDSKGNIWVSTNKTVFKKLGGFYLQSQS